MAKFLTKAAFGGEALIRGRHVLEGDANFDLIVKWTDTYLKLGAYKRKYDKAEDTQQS